MVENYDKLKQVIQQANPEIMELKFGCEVAHKKDNYIIARFNHHLPILKEDLYEVVSEYSMQSISSSQITKILGRPIRLADVLLAYEEVPDDPDDKEPFTNWVLGRRHIVGNWDCTKDNLDNQSEETKQFLIDLLVK